MAYTEVFTVILTNRFQAGATVGKGIIWRAVGNNLNRTDKPGGIFCDN